ncbi:MAG: hypothetical protein ACRD36_14340, partial [Candidatus Acidiferrum sp.]
MSTCEIPSASKTTSSPSGSRVLRFQLAADVATANTWAGVPMAEYKAAADHHCGVTRTVLVGDNCEQTAFHVRYFESAPGGYSS